MAWYDAVVPGLGGLTGNADQYTAMFAPFIGSGMVNAQNQEENLKYQKELQQQIFAREDNAVRRRVNDLKKAGMNPVLAAGQPAQAGQAIGTTAPNYQDPGASLASVIPVIGSVVNMAQGLAQVENIRADTAIKSTESTWRNAILSGRSNQMAANVARDLAGARLQNQDADILGKAGLPSRGGNHFFALIKQLLHSKDLVPEVKALLESLFGDLKELLPSLPSLPGFRPDTSPEAKASVDRFINKDRSSPGAF